MVKISRHLELGSADTREVARNPHDNDVMSNEMSSDVYSDIIYTIEQITFDDGINPKDTSHKARAVSQGDDDFQLYTLVNGVMVSVMIRLALRLYPR